MQEEIYSNAMRFPTMSRQEKLEHIEQLTELLLKQKIMYTRVSLSDDPEAVEMKENLNRSMQMMGFPPHMDLNHFFDSMNKTIDALKEHIDK